MVSRFLLSASFLTLCLASPALAQSPGERLLQDDRVPSASPQLKNRIFNTPPKVIKRKQEQTEPESNNDAQVSEDTNEVEENTEATPSVDIDEEVNLEEEILEIDPKDEDDIIDQAVRDAGIDPRRQEKSPYTDRDGRSTLSPEDVMKESPNFLKMKNREANTDEMGR